MSSYHVNTTRPGVYAPRDECAPVVCPECGGLECLCRPRFFAGQLLTDEDLNRLDHYIVEKGKLRNRYLHGWGVACGLEVVCHPCNAVTVAPGYALSPCGEDIVVCAPVQVDVCDLINKCRDEQRRRWECEPARPATGVEDCKDVYEEWVLAIRYEEKPSRGVMALRGGGGCGGGSRCGCGGSGSCGCGGQKSSSSCGCGGSSSAGQTTTRTTKTARKGAQAQCEPTVVCESYAFEVYKLPRRTKEGHDPGALFNRAGECFNRLKESLPKAPTNQDKAAWHEWCCNLKESLLDLLAEHPAYDCLLAEELARVACPEPQNNQTPQQYIDLIRTQVLPHIAMIGAEYMRYCMCSALLPPCPGPVADPRVPLATVTVRRDNCRIIRVCNIGIRKFLTTFPNLQYWFSFIPLVREFRKLLERVCCEPFRRPAERDRPVPPTPPPPGGTVPQSSTQPTTAASEGEPGNEAEASAAAGGGGGGGDDDNVDTSAGRVVTDAAAPVLPQNEFFQVLARAWGNREKTVDARTLFLGAIGATDEQGEPLLTPAELNNPLLFIGLNQVARPAIVRVPASTPDVLANIIRLGRGGAAFTNRSAVAEEGAARAAEDIDEVKAQLARLEEVVRRQQETIAELSERLG